MTPIMIVVLWYAGPWRDLAVERACTAVGEFRRDASSNDLPEKLQELSEAPAGSVMLLTSCVYDTAIAVFTPSDTHQQSPVPFLPYDAVFSPIPEMPLW